MLAFRSCCALCAVAILLMPGLGCNARQVRRQHNALLAEVTGLQYTQVLNNLAMFRSRQGRLPHFSVVNSATSQMQHSNTAGGNLNWNPTTLTSEALNLNGSRSLSGQFGGVPVTDPDKLRRLACAIDLAICGYSVDVMPVDVVQNNETHLQFEVASSSGCINCIRELINVGVLPSADASKLAGPRTFRFKLEEDAFEYQQQLIEALQCQIPTCWFGFGKSSDIPKDALYVGRFDKCYTWVTCKGVEQLSRFTLTMLDLATKDPPSRTVEIRRLLKTPQGEIEIKGSVVGTMAEYVEPEEIGELRELEEKELSQRIDQSIRDNPNKSTDNFLKQYDNTLMEKARTKGLIPGKFEAAPSRSVTPFSIQPQGLIVTPN